MRDIYYIFILVVLSILDVWITGFNIEYFNANELNPIVAYIIHYYGYLGFLLAKYLGIICIYGIIKTDYEYKKYYWSFALIIYGIPVIYYILSFLAVVFHL